MKSNSQERAKEIDKQIAIVSIIDTLGSIMFGLGLYAKFASDGDAFLPILNNNTVVNTMLVVGAAIMLWGGYKILMISREKRELKNTHEL